MGPPHVMIPGGYEYRISPSYLYGYCWTAWHGGARWITSLGYSATEEAAHLDAQWCIAWYEAQKCS